MNLTEFFAVMESIRVNTDKKHTFSRGTDIMYPIYIILYAQNSFVSKSIRKATNTPYSHASISFDTSMQNIFSFGKLKIDMGNDKRELKNGAIRESFISKKGMRAFPQDAKYEVYTLFVSKDNLDTIKKKVHEIFDNPDGYKFSIIGLLRYYLGMTSESTSKMFCSQFVASLLAAGNVHLDRAPSLYSPYELKDIQNVKYVDSGILKDYNRTKFDRLMDDIIKEMQEPTNMDAE